MKNEFFTNGTSKFYVFVAPNRNGQLTIITLYVQEEPDCSAGGDGLLILNVGPSKTGTSSIQCTLERSPFLQNSSYTYLGRYENERTVCSPAKYPLQDPILKHQRFFPQNIVFGGGQRDQKRAAWKIKHRLLELKGEYEDKNSTTSGNVSIPPYPPCNAILSAEEFEGMPQQDEKTWDVLKDALSPYKGRTRVIVAYRKLYEKFVSLYYELIVGRDTPASWDDPGITPFPTFWSSSGRYYATGNMTSALVAAYEEHSFNVSIFDFHGRGDGKGQGDDLVTRFLCDLPCAEAACNAYKNDLATKGKDAASRPSLKARPQYDIIAKEAYERGLLGKYDLLRSKNTRKAAVRAIEDYVVNKLGIKYTELPLLCPSMEELDKILKLSIEDGKRVWKHHNFDEEKHVKDFQAYVDKKKFCAVDVDALMKVNDWAHFLQNELFSYKNTKN